MMAVAGAWLRHRQCRQLLLPAFPLLQQLVQFP